MFEIRVIDYGDGLVVCSDELDIESSEITKNEMWLDGGHPSTVECVCRDYWMHFMTL